ncbi:MAG: YlxM family DNA-binding protein [Lachnospiraceae bacterium]|jgi:predicted DNA-binding protein YlxM (UPF0122 family)
MSGKSIDIEKKYEEALLFDFYGELLTDNQKEVFQEAVLEDYSLAEIAEERGISRQGVHDMIRRTRALLREYEDKLHLVSRFLKIKHDVNRIYELTEDLDIRRIAENILEEL